MQPRPFLPPIPKLGFRSSEKGSAWSHRIPISVLQYTDVFAQSDCRKFLVHEKIMTIDVMHNFGFVFDTNNKQDFAESNVILLTSCCT